MTDATGLVLAGGQSRRMGRDKSALPLDGQTFLEIACHKLEAAGCRQILVSGPGGLPDRYPGAGPLAGLDAAIATLADETHLLVIPVDMPNLQAGLLQQLTKAIGTKPGCYFTGHPLPACLRVSDALRMLLMKTLGQTNANRSLFHLYEQLQFCPMETNPNQFKQFLNCNTPEELAAWKATK